MKNCSKPAEKPVFRNTSPPTSDLSGSQRPSGCPFFKVCHSVFFISFQTAGLFLLKPVSGNLKIPGQNSQSRIPLKSGYPVIRAAVHAAVFRRTDGGFNRRMPMSESHKLFGKLSFPLFFGKPAFLGKDNKIQKFPKSIPVFGCVKAPVKTACPEIRKPFLYLRSLRVCRQFPSASPDDEG